MPISIQFYDWSTDDLTATCSGHSPETITQELKWKSKVWRQCPTYSTHEMDWHHIKFCNVRGELSWSSFWKWLKTSWKVVISEIWFGTSGKLGTWLHQALKQESVFVCCWFNPTTDLACCWEMRFWIPARNTWKIILRIPNQPANHHFWLLKRLLHTQEECPARHWGQPEMQNTQDFDKHCNMLWGYDMQSLQIANQHIFAFLLCQFQHVSEHSNAHCWESLEVTGRFLMVFLATTVAGTSGLSDGYILRSLIFLIVFFSILYRHIVSLMRRKRMKTTEENAPWTCRFVLLTDTVAVEESSSRSQHW